MPWMDVTSDYWLPHGFDNMVETLRAAEREQLVALIINNRYNDFVRKLADYRDEDQPIDPTDEHGRDHGKRVPYIGWFWRSTDFYHKDISIGDCGDFVGVMENNKWGYAERRLTEAECDQVIAIIDAAMAADRAGGLATEIVKNTRREIERLWSLFQTFEIDPSTAERW